MTSGNRCKKTIRPLAVDQPEHPITADSLKPIVEKYREEGKDFNMGMVFPVSTHNYEIPVLASRRWYQSRFLYQRKHRRHRRRRRHSFSHTAATNALRR